MSDQGSSKSFTRQKHEDYDEDSSDYGRRKRAVKEKAKKEGKQILPCAWCEKQYLSYPALYTHCKHKHPGQKISSKNTTKQNKNPPIQKMKTLLRQSIQTKNQQIERKLLMTINKSALEIIYQLKELEPGLGKQLGKFNKGLLKTKDVKKKGLEFALTINLDQKLLQSGEKIFKQLPGKIAGISFGGDILQTFINSKIASKLYLHLAILSNFESYEQELVLIQEKIWSNISADWKFLFQNWKQYQQTLKLVRKQQQSK